MGARDVLLATYEGLCFRMLVVCFASRLGVRCRLFAMSLPRQICITIPNTLSGLQSANWSCVTTCVDAHSGAVAC